MSRRGLGPALVILLLACSDGGGADDGVGPPAPLATLSGAVREESNGHPVAGATVAVGSASTTTDQAGLFKLAVPIGTDVSVTVTGSGFDSLVQSMVILAGETFRSFLLFRVNTIHESDGFLLYVPQEVSTVRGVYLHMYGEGVDSRPMIRGDTDYYDAFAPVSDAASFRTRLMAFARANGFAIMGAQFRASDQNAVTYQRLLASLVTASGRIDRAELAHVPLLLNGSSRGGCIAYDFTVLHPERVIGFLAAKSPCLDRTAGPAAMVPGYFFLGELDSLGGIGNVARIVDLFEKNRALGAVWALAVEPGAGHAPVANHDLLLNWAAEIADRRLPESIEAGAPVVLRPVSEYSGWLADRSSFAIAEFDCYSGHKLTASWLPSEQTARSWQAMVSRRTVSAVIACGT
jgi:hypothetical protein